MKTLEFTLFALLLAPSNPLSAAERPNFVIVMADDLGYGDIGCYGSSLTRTPHLDRLAAEGIHFTDFHSSGAVCSPTRAGLMTGRYQQRAGIPSVIFADATRPTHTHGLQDREITFAERLGQAGYKTAIFGKWHLGYAKKYNPVHHGFSQFRGYVSGNVDFFSHVDQAGRLDWWRNDEIDDEPGYTTHLITRHSLAFIEANKDKPFCLYVPYEPPHYPYQGPNDEPIRSVGNERPRRATKRSDGVSPRVYSEMIEAMDDGIGQIVASLKEHGIERRTLVMFFSDNGATRRGSNGRLRGHKSQVWEGGHRVPCIAWWPGTIPRDSVSHDLAITLDVMPTLLAAAKVDPPADRTLDGVNLLPVITTSESLDTRKLYWQHGNARAMRDGSWKLVANVSESKRPMLFDLSDDLAEESDLAEQHPARAKQMMAAIDAWERDTADGASRQPGTSVETQRNTTQEDDEPIEDLTTALGRGVNLGNIFEAPREGLWGVKFEDRYIDLIVAAGFDSVRIPVRWSAHAAQEAPYTIDPDFFDRVERAVKLATSRGLYTVLNMHHYEEIFEQPNEHHDRFLALWRQIGERYRDYPENLYFELLNEPHAELDADTWNALAAEGIALVRKTNPTRKIVVGPPAWNNVDALQSLVLPDTDRNLIVTFHYYKPFHFTHQGARWVGDQSNKWLGTTWTGTAAERRAVTADLDKARAWGLKQRRPMFLGEFGAYSKAGIESRARWTRFVADEAVKRKMGFAYWEFCSGFGVYDSTKDAWVEPLRNALLPSAKSTAKP